MKDQRVLEAQAEIDEDDRLDTLTDKARASLTYEYFMSFKHEIDQRRPTNIACWFDELGLDYFEMMLNRLQVIEQEFIDPELDDVISTMWMCENDYTKIKCAVDEILSASPNFEQKVAALVERAERGEVEF